MAYMPAIAWQRMVVAERTFEVSWARVTDTLPYEVTFPSTFDPAPSRSPSMISHHLSRS